MGIKKKLGECSPLMILMWTASWCMQRAKVGVATCTISVPLWMRSLQNSFLGVDDWSVPGTTNFCFYAFYILGACATTKEFLDNKICTFKISLSWRFPRKNSVFGRFSSLPPRPPSPQKARKHFYCRLAVSDICMESLGTCSQKLTNFCAPFFKEIPFFFLSAGWPPPKPSPHPSPWILHFL